MYHVFVTVEEGTASLVVLQNIFKFFVITLCRSSFFNNLNSWVYKGKNICGPF